MRIFSSLVVCFWSFQDGDFCFWKVGNSSGYALSPHPASSILRDRGRDIESAWKGALGLFLGGGRSCYRI